MCQHLDVGDDDDADSDHSDEDDDDDNAADCDGASSDAVDIVGIQVAIDTDGD